MSNRGYGSLAGKARRTHQQNRFQEWINREWMEEATSHDASRAGDDRYIPVNYGSNVLKAVGFSDSEMTVASSAAGESATGTMAMPTPGETVSTGAKIVSAESKPAEAIIPSRRATTPAEQVIEEGRFSLGRFLAGCLLGGSAAAAILAVLYIIIG